MQFVIFHGAYGSPSGNWFPYLKEEFEKLDQKVLVPEFPVEDWNTVTKTKPKNKPKNQDLEVWLKVFEKEVYPKIKNEKHLCFIGHSLGPLFILHACGKFNLKLDLAIFVAPFLWTPNTIWQIDYVNQSFYKKKIDFKKIRKLISHSYVFYGDNDPYVPKKYPLEFAKKIGSSIIPVKGGKHMNAEAGYTRFPLVLKLCRETINQPA